MIEDDQIPYYYTRQFTLNKAGAEPDPSNSKDDTLPFFGPDKTQPPFDPEKTQEFRFSIFTAENNPETPPHPQKDPIKQLSAQLSSRIEKAKDLVGPLYERILKKVQRARSNVGNLPNEHHSLIADLRRLRERLNRANLKDDTLPPFDPEKTQEFFIPQSHPPETGAPRVEQGVTIAGNSFGSTVPKDRTTDHSAVEEAKQPISRELSIEERNEDGFVILPNGFSAVIDGVSNNLLARQTKDRLIRELTSRMKDLPSFPSEDQVRREFSTFMTDLPQLMKDEKEKFIRENPAECKKWLAFHKNDSIVASHRMIGAAFSMGMYALNARGKQVYVHITKGDTLIDAVSRRNLDPVNYDAKSQKQNHRITTAASDNHNLVNFLPQDIETFVLKQDHVAMILCTDGFSDNVAHKLEGDRNKDSHTYLSLLNDREQAINRLSIFDQLRAIFDPNSVDTALRRVNRKFVGRMIEVAWDYSNSPMSETSPKKPKKDDITVVFSLPPKRG